MDADGNPLPAGSIARLGTSRWREGARLWGLQLSPNGKVVAYTTQPGDVRILDPATGREVKRLVAPRDQAVGHPFFSPDGRLLAVAGREKSIQILEITTGKLLHTIRGKEAFFSAAFSGDGRVLATGGGFPDKNVRTWNVATGKEAGIFEVIPKNGAYAVLSSDGNKLATWAADPREAWSNREIGNQTQIWDVASRKEIHRLTAEAPVLALGFAPSGKEVAIDTFKTLQIFELATGKVRELSRGQGETGIPFSVVSYAPRGNKLAIYSPTSPIFENTFTLWDAAAGKPQSRPPGPCSASSVVFAGDRILACGGHGHTVRVWDVGSGKDLVPVSGHCGAITSLVWSSDDKGLISADSKGSLCTWDVRRGRMISDTQVCYDRENNHFSDAGICAVAPDRKHVIATEDRRQPFVRMLDGSSRREYLIAITEQLTEAMTAFAATKPAALITGEAPRLAGDEQFAVYAFDVQNGKVTRQLTLPSIAMGVALSGDANRAAAAYETDREQEGERYAVAVRLWDAETGKVLRELKNISFTRDWNVNRIPLTFAPDRRFLAAGENGGLVGLWNPETGKRLRTFGGTPGWQVGALFVFPDQSMVAVGAHDLESGQAKIQLRELASGDVRAEFVGHSGPVTSFALSGDGRVLASGSCDTTIVLWDLTGLAKWRTERLSPTDTEGLWAQLGGQDAGRAYRAIWRLAASPQEAVAMLASKLKFEPDNVPSSADIARLIRQLDDASFTARERAVQELRRVGEPARELLKDLLGRQPSEETRRRVESLLADLDSGRPMAEDLAGLRAVEVLEYAGTPEARALLGRLASGRKDRALTHAAGMALKALSGRPNSSRP